MTKTDKRSSARLDLRVAVQVGNQSRLQQFYSRNLSSGGIFIEVAGDLPVIGTKLSLNFDVPGLKQSFQVEAEVLHHHHYETMDDQFRKTERTGIGLRFLNLSPEHKGLIEKYISGKGVIVRS